MRRPITKVCYLGGRSPLSEALYSFERSGVIKVEALAGVEQEGNRFKNATYYDKEKLYNFMFDKGTDIFIIDIGFGYDFLELQAFCKLVESKEMCPKAVLCGTPPTYGIADIQKMMTMYESMIEKRRRLGWPTFTLFFLDPIRSEPAFETFANHLEEMGSIIGVSLIARRMPGMSENCSAPQGTYEYNDTFQYCCNLLRRLFGEFDCGTTAKNAAWLKLANGAACSLTILPRSTTFSMFSLVAWTEMGKATLYWDTAKDVYVVQRNLKHFEHPTVHPLSGVLTELGKIIEIAGQNSAPLIHLSNFAFGTTVVEELLKSQGALTVFKAAA